jgi:ADP-ribose pyrophosphatase YjhB (NUDIX family)
MRCSYQNMLISVLDQIRAIGETGLCYAENPHDRERYKRLLKITVTSLAAVSGVGEQELSERFSREIGCITPKVGVDAAIFDEEQRLLLHKRSDDGKWSLPCGWVEVGESLAEAAVREVKEETGLAVEPTYILGIYDSKAIAPHAPHSSCYILYLCEPRGGSLVISHESTDIGYLDINTVTEWHNGHEEKGRDALDFIKHRMPFRAIEIAR